MFTGRNYPLTQTLNWSKRYILIFVLLSTIPVVIYHFTEYRQIVVPWLPISLIGTAVAFYLGFKNNASYERLWEARKIWGGISTGSRVFGMMVRGYIQADSQLANQATGAQERLIKRHLAWVNALRFQMRTPREWEHTRTDIVDNGHFPPTAEQKQDLEELLKQYIAAEELSIISDRQNKAAHLLELQMQDLTRINQANLLEDFRYMSLAALLKEMYEHQGASERIKNFPFPRQYASLSIYFVWLFIILLPFGLIQEFMKIGEQYVWLTIPASVMIAWVFHTMELIGDFSENPFEGLDNDVPITSMSRNIEIDLLEMINASNIPDPLTPHNKILM